MKRPCRFGEGIIVLGPTSRAVGRLLEEEEDDEIAVLANSIADSDGPF